MSEPNPEGRGPDSQSGTQSDTEPGAQLGNESGTSADGDPGRTGDHRGGLLEGPPRTGDPAVDAALAAAAAVQNAEPADQLETYVGTHRALQDRLADSGG